MLFTAQLRCRSADELRSSATAHCCLWQQADTQGSCCGASGDHSAYSPVTLSAFSMGCHSWTERLMPSGHSGSCMCVVCMQCKCMSGPG